MPPGVWEKYKTHLQANHPAFEKWSRRSSLTYFLALVPFFGFALAASASSSASQASLLAILMFPAGLATILAIWTFQHGVKSGFRQSWLRDHPAAPKSPL